MEDTLASIQTGLVEIHVRDFTNLSHIRAIMIDLVAFLDCSFTLRLQKASNPIYKSPYEEQSPQVSFSR